MSVDAHGKFAGKRLVVFGAGYVGQAVAAEALAGGCEVTALTRNPKKAEALRARGIDVVTAELASDAWHAKIPDGADYVLNCVSSGGGGIDGYRRSYVDGTRSILAWAAASGGVGTLVYTSSTSVYPQSGGAIIDERATHEGVSETGRVLLEAEESVRTASRACERWFILRLAGIYGPGRHHLLDQLRAGAAEIAGRGDHQLNLIHRDDIVAAIWAAFGAPAAVRNEIFNIADDGAAPKADVMNWLAERLGREPPRFNGAPAGGRRAITPDRTISNAKAKAVLGWQPRYADFRSGFGPLLEA